MRWGKFSIVLCSVLAAVGAPALVWAAPSPAASRTVVVVSPAETDKSLAGGLPRFYSGTTLTNELATALEATGVFTVPTRDPHEIKLLIDEWRATKGKSARAKRAKYLLIPLIASITLDRRERPAPAMRSKVLVSVGGSASLFVTVIDTATGDTKRLPVDITYQTPEQLADPGTYDLGLDRATHGDADAPAFVALAQAIGKAFATRVINQVSPVLVADVDGDQIYLTRGQDAGYHIGEVLRVLHRGRKVINPVTHEEIASVDRQIGEAEVIEVQPKVSIARLRPGAAAVAIGDIVREPVAGAEEN